MIISRHLSPLLSKAGLITKILILFLVLGSCIPIKSIFLGRPDARDSSRFDSQGLTSSNCFLYAHSTDSINPRVSDWTSDKPEFKSVLDLFKEHSVRSFILVQNDTIKLEYHKDGLNSKSLHPSHSLAKSFISCLIGIAIEEGLIKNVDQKVSDFIPEITTKKHSQMLTIRHLLNHTSGIKYSLINDAQLYYGKDIIGQLKKIEFESAPGTKQRYLNINSQLLGIIIKRCTGMSVTAYTQKKLWGPIQMCSNGSWSVDKSNIEKSFCCLSATMIDYAKFGRLYLKKGLWENKRVFSESWFNESICRDTTEGSSYNYNYSWHIGLQEYEDFMAIGLYKQHIYISSKKNIVMVLLNDRENSLVAERVNWWFFFRQLVDQL